MELASQSGYPQSAMIMLKLQRHIAVVNKSVTANNLSDRQS